MGVPARRVAGSAHDDLIEGDDRLLHLLGDRIELIGIQVAGDNVDLGDRHVRCDIVVELLHRLARIAVKPLCVAIDVANAREQGHGSKCVVGQREGSVEAFTRREVPCITLAREGLLRVGTDSGAHHQPENPVAVRESMNVPTLHASRPNRPISEESSGRSRELVIVALVRGVGSQGRQGATSYSTDANATPHGDPPWRS